MNPCHPSYRSSEALGVVALLCGKDFLKKSRGQALTTRASRVGVMIRNSCMATSAPMSTERSNL